MIVLDTSVLVYAVGTEHPLLEPSRRVVEAITLGRVRGTTTIEVVQEFAHTRAQRRDRSNAVSLARTYAALLGPLLSTTDADLDKGLQLFQKYPRLGSFDALLAATALRVQAGGLVSGDLAFADVAGLTFLPLGSPELDALIG